jgi:RES domain-containing protein
MRHVRRGGRYLRVADPGWSDPLSGAYSRVRGGRWNPPQSFDVVYLNRTIEVARAQVRCKLTPLAIGPEDLDPRSAPTLVATKVPEAPYVDAISDPGFRSLGLPQSYPRDGDGEIVGHGTCQAIGTEAKAAGEPGVAARSAAEIPSPGEELAWFGPDALAPGERRDFADWFWPRSGA